MSSLYDTGVDTRVRSLAVTGTAGVGTVSMVGQSGRPANSGNLIVYADSNNSPTWLISGLTTTLNVTGNTADRVYSLPDRSDFLATREGSETLKNKSILSADGNTIEATSLRGTPISGTPTTGQILHYNGTAYTPITLVGAAPITFDGTNIGATVGSTASTLAAGNDGRFITPQKITVKKSSPGDGEFTSIGAALASIVDSAQSKPYILNVLPGVYVESNLVVPQWVAVCGPGIGSAVTVSVQTATGFTMMPNTVVRGLTVLAGNATAIAGTGILIDSTGSCLIQDTVVRGFATGILLKATTAATNATLLGLFVRAFLTAVFVDGRAATGAYPISVIMNANNMTGDSTSVRVLRVDGPSAVVLSYTMVANDAVNATVVQLSDGADVEFSFSRIRNCGNGIVTRNIGAAPKIRATAVSIVSSLVRDVSLEHPGTTGIFTGIADRAKVFVDPSVVATFNYSDSNGGTTITGGLYYSSQNSTGITEVGDQITYASPLGVYHGGELSGTGFTVNVAAGRGYIANGMYPTQTLQKLDWGNLSIVLPASTTAYIYIDSIGLQYALSAPSLVSAILLGRVRTSASGASPFEFIDSQQISIDHPYNKYIAVERVVTGPQYASGSIVTANGFNLNVSSGTYYYLDNPYQLVGGSPIVWLQYYHSGGIFTYTQTGTVTNTQYDDGTALTAIPAGKFVKHSLYTVGNAANEKYLMVVGRTLFDSLSLATNGSLPTPPNYFSEGIVLIAAVIVQQGSSTLNIVDLRPRGSSTTGVVSSGGVTDHGDLLGLLDDDHTQYLLTNGTRSMNGNLDLGGNNIINAGLLDGIDIMAHASRHLPNGADPLTTGSAVSITAVSVNGVGTANAFARSNHTHTLDVSGVSINSLTGVANVAHGGTGVATLTSGGVLVGNGTSAVLTTKAAPGGVFVGTTDVQTLTNKTLLDSTTFIADATDNTKQLTFDIGGTTGTATTITSSQTANRTLTLPDATDTIIARTTTDTLTNKTITGATNTVDASGLRTTGASVVVSGSAAPSTGQVLAATSATTAAWSTPTSTFLDTNFAVGDAADNTKQVKFDVGGASGTSTTLTSTQTVNRTLTLPDITDTILGRTTTDTLTNKTITGGSGGNTVSADFVRAVGVGAVAPTTGQTLVATSATTSTWQNLGINSTSGVADVAHGGTGNATLTSNGVLVGNGTGAVNTAKAAPTGVFVGTIDSQILTNKTLLDSTTVIADATDNTKQVKFDVGGGTGTATTITSSQTANRVLTLPDITDILVTRTTTDTLTNKTIIGSTNQIDASGLQTTGATVVVSGSAAPSTGQALIATSATTATWQTPSNTFVDTAMSIVDSVDATKRIAFDAVGTTGTTTTITSSQTANRTLTLPNITDTIVTKNTVDTLTNKTLTTPVIAQIVNTGTLTLPTSTDTIIGRNTTDILTNKTLLDSTTIIADAVDATKQIKFDVGGNTGTITTIASVAVANRTLTLPDITDTLVTKTTVDTLTNKTITGGSGGNTVSADLLRAVGVGAVAPTTNQVLVATSGTTATWQTLNINTTGNTLTVANGGTGVTTLTSGNVLIGNGTSAVLTTKVAPSGIFVGTDDTQLLSNKSLVDSSTFIVDATDATKRIAFDAVGTTSTTTTITSSQTTNRVLTLPDATDLLIARATTDTLTNKNITGATNTVDASGLRTTGASVIVSGGAPPTTGQALMATGATTATWQTPATTFVDTAFRVTDSVDATKRIAFDAVGTTSTTTTVTSSQTANRVLTLPDITDTLVSKNTVDTLTNKTLTAPIIATIVNTGTLTLPTTSDTIIGRNTTDTLTNKSLVDASTSIVDSVDATKKILFDVGGSTGTSTTISSNQTTNRVLLLPDTNDTLVTKNTVDTLTNKTIVGGSDGNTVSADQIYGTVMSNVAPTFAQVIQYNGTIANWTTLELNDAPSILNVAHGGTGLATLTAGNVLVGNGTSNVDISKVAPSGVFVGTTDTQTLTNKSLVDATTIIVDSVDSTKHIAFDVVGATGTTTTIASSQTANRILTLPNITDTVVTKNTVDVLTNKTLTTPIIATIVNTGTLTLPTTTDTLLGRNTTDTLTNKTLLDSTTVIADVADTTKQIKFDVGGTSGTSTTFLSTQTTNRVIVLPDINDTLVTRTTTDTLTNKTIIGGANGNDLAANKLYAVVVSAVAPATGNILTATGTTAASWQALSVTNATGTLPVGAGGTGAMTLTAGNFVVGNGTATVSTNKIVPIGVVVGTTDTQTLTNKTLTTPIIASISNTGTLTLPTSTDTLIGRDTVDTLTNKTIVGGSNGNDVDANSIKNVDISSVAPTTGQILIATSASAASWQNASAIQTTYYDSIIPPGTAVSGTTTYATCMSTSALAFYLFPGTTNKVITAVSVYYNVSTSGNVYGFRLLDVISGNVYCEDLTLTFSGDKFVTLVCTNTGASLQNTGLTSLVCQYRRVTGASGTLTIKGIMIAYRSV